MKINGIEVDFRISNLKHAGNMEIALQNMKKGEDKIRKLGKDAPMSKVLAETIKMIRDFFVEATGVDVLEGCEDLAEAQHVYYDFLDEVKKQKEGLLNPFSTSRIE